MRKYFIFLISIAILGCGAGERAEPSKTVYKEKANGEKIVIQKVYNNDKLETIVLENITINLSNSLEKENNGSSINKATTPTEMLPINSLMIPFYIKAYPKIPKYFISLKDSSGLINPSEKQVGLEYTISIKMSWNSATLFSGETIFILPEGKKEVDISMIPTEKINPEIPIIVKEGEIVKEILNHQRGEEAGLIEIHKVNGLEYRLRSLRTIDFNANPSEYIEIVYESGNSTVVMLNYQNMIKYLDTGLYTYEFLSSTISANVSFDENQFTWYKLIQGINIVQDDVSYTISTTVPSDGYSLDITGTLSDVGILKINSVSVNQSSIILNVDDLIEVIVFEAGNSASQVTIKVN